MKFDLARFMTALKEELRLFLGISIGVFLFILFFQPFPLDGFDFNNRLIFVAGLGLIVFVMLTLVRIGLSSIIQNLNNNKPETTLPYYMSGFIIMSLSSVAFAFYLYYVGSIPISFYIIFKVIVICLAPPVIIWMHDEVRSLRKVNESLRKELNETKHQLIEHRKNIPDKIIEFISETGSENFSLPVSNVALIKSADNYVEIVYEKSGIYNNKLLRSSLRNIEQQLKPFPDFIRCHRTCIVNKKYIEKLNRTNNNYWLTLKGIDEQIPVSRQYLLKLKEIIQS